MKLSVSIYLSPVFVVTVMRSPQHRHQKDKEEGAIEKRKRGDILEVKKSLQGGLWRFSGMASQRHVNVKPWLWKEQNIV